MVNESRAAQLVAVNGTLLDFKHLDLSSWKIRGSLIENSETEEFIKSISPIDNKDHNWKLIKEEAQGGESGGLIYNWEYVNLLWPIDFNDPPTEEDYIEAIETIRLIHPSEVHIQTTFDVAYQDGLIYFESWSQYSWHDWGKYSCEPLEKYFYYPPKELEATNKFLANYKLIEKPNYIRNAIRYYSESFRVNTAEMSFICLCICLETIVPGKEQVSYRFRRNLAVLCSESIETGQLIYQNAKKLYEYRSKLVHSGLSKKDFKSFDKFFEYAQVLASRMIIEMILHNISTIENLDIKLTEIGMGENHKISKDYVKFEGNIFTWVKVSYYKFTD